LEELFPIQLKFFWEFEDCLLQERMEKVALPSLYQKEKNCSPTPLPVSSPRGHKVNMDF
jgi:hypothetical protein